MEKIISVYGNFDSEEEFDKCVSENFRLWDEDLKNQKIKTNQAQKVYYCEYNHHIRENGQRFCSSEATTDKNRAKELDKNYRLATLDEVNEELSVGGEFPQIIETSDGIYGWYEQEYISGLGDEEFYCGYIFLQPNSEWEIEDLRRCFGKMLKN